MDRRRFVPSPEGLEVRTMLSTTGSSFNLFGNSVDVDPVRADHLPAEGTADSEDSQ